MDNKAYKTFLIGITWILIINGIGIEFSLHAQKRLKFERFTIEQNLSQNSVYCIFQDHKEFLWIGTEDGLNRYDGYNFKIYKHHPDQENSLSDNYIRAFGEDPQKILWVGTQRGLNRFDRENDYFVHYHGIPGMPKELENANITCIARDKKGIMWIGTFDKGLFRYNYRTRQFFEFASYSRLTHIYSIYPEGNEKLWIGTDKGVFVLNTMTKDLKPYKVNTLLNTKNDSDKVYNISADRKGNIWIGTASGGIRRYDRSKDMFVIENYESQTSQSGQFIPVMSILHDKRGNLWIGRQNGGVYIKPPNSRTFIQSVNKSAIPTSLSSNNVNVIFEDKAGIIWIGTESGLNKLDWNKSSFQHWTEEPGNKSSLSDNYVWAFLEDKDNTLWVGTSYALNKFDEQAGNFTHYKVDPQVSTNSFTNHVRTIYQDSKGILWVGFHESGLRIFDPKKESFTIAYTYNPKNVNSISNSRITAIIEDHSNQFWIGTPNGLNLMDRYKGIFQHFFPNPDSKSEKDEENNIVCMYLDRQENLWVGTPHGLKHFDLKTKVFSKYPDKPGINLSHDYINFIYEDRRDFLWVGTPNGLNRIDRKKQVLENFFEQDGGLPSSTVYGIVEDDNGFLWISTGKGISMFDPNSFKTKNYDARDGLQGDEFNGRSCYKSPRTHELYFGGTNGFSSFFPSTIKKNEHHPPIVITNFLVFNEPFFKQSVIEKNEFPLDYSNNVFTIEFAALDFASPSKNRYRYKMDGVDRDWVKADASKRFATYTKLSPGKYTFHVTGTNSDGHGNEEKLIYIVIEPPFYLTKWFFAAVFLTIIAMLIVGYRLRTRILRNKLAEQERIQKILKKSRDEMEHARDLAEIRHAENEKLLTAISSIFIAVDSNGIIFQWNSPAETFFKLSAEEAIKKPFADTLKNYISEEKLNEIMKKGLEQGQTSMTSEIEVDIKAREKGIRLLIARVNPITDSIGRNLGFLLLAEDITNRKAEEMLRNLSKKLESLGQMASGIAHEIKTPLQYIGNNARFVADSFPIVSNFYKMIIEALSRIESSTPSQNEITGKLKKTMEDNDMDYIINEIPTASGQIIDGVKRVSDIITAMNEFSHPGKGYKEKTRIDELLKSTLLMAQSRIKKHADVVLEFSNELPPLVCFPGELSQVLLNILINAGDAIIESGKWGVITITTFVERNEIVISISDTGCGIPEEHRDNIFNPFFTTKDVGKGTGQGLSLAHNIIIEKHKGKLDFKSKVGEGTTFYIRLPIEGEHEHGKNFVY